MVPALGCVVTMPDGRWSEGREGDHATGRVVTDDRGGWSSATTRRGPVVIWPMVADDHGRWSCRSRMAAFLMKMVHLKEGIHLARHPILQRVPSYARMALKLSIGCSLGLPV